VWIAAIPDPVGSYVRTWTSATVFAIYVRIVALAPLIIHRFDLWSPDWAFNACLLDDPTGANSAQHLYRMLDKSSFHRSEVLNHRVDAEGKLRRGDVIEGLLLAQTLQSVPVRYAASRRLPFSLSIMNQFGDVRDFAFALPVERIASPIRARPGRTGGLFELKEAPANGAVLHAPEVLVKKQRSASVKEQANGKSDCPPRAGPD
jgi:hypothetical protein